MSTIVLSFVSGGFVSSSCAINFSFSVPLYLISVLVFILLSGRYWMFNYLVDVLCWFLLLGSCIYNQVPVDLFCYDLVYLIFYRVFIWYSYGRFLSVHVVWCSTWLMWLNGYFLRSVCFLLQVKVKYHHCCFWGISSLYCGYPEAVFASKSLINISTCLFFFVSS